MLSRFIQAMAVAAMLASPLALAQKKTAADYTVEDFMRRAEYQSMVLSPDGQKLAAGVPYKGRQNLVVIDLGKRTRSIITAFETQDAATFWWVNNQRLCFRAADGQAVTGGFNYRGTYCVDSNGQNLRDFSQLGIRNPSIGRFRTITPAALLPGDTDEMIVAMTDRSEDSVDLFRLDSRNGKYEIITYDSPGDVKRWVLDHDFVPRIAVSDPERKRGQAAKRLVWYRDGKDAKWEKIAEVELIGSGWAMSADFEPIAFDYDNTTLYVSANPAGRDRAAIYKYDTKARKLGELVFEDANVDVTGGLVFSRVKRKLMGISYQGAKPVTRWLDDDMDKLQKSVDARFKDTHNAITLPRAVEGNALIYSYSDVNPGEYRLYDKARNGVEEIAKTRGWLDPALMSERRFIKYKARDGREIPAYVTIPKGSDGKNLPLIVNVHGGPWARAYTWTSWGRWPDAQFFASRGYAVLEPEPRGSTGWGHDLFASSFRQWGLAMQDDINDGALYLASQGIVDKSRMCLFGGSYGGYASAMGITRDPDLWKCAAPFVAVTDLFLFQDVVYSDIAQGSDFFETDFKKMVGDSKDDREMFTRSSPVKQAGNVKGAIFLAMGGSDVRVPQVHGDAFYNAVTKAGGKIEYKVYPGEAHGFNKDENVFDFYSRLEKFFAENLKKK